MKRVVLLYSELIPSVRLCGYEQLTYLAQQGKLSFEALPLRAVTQKCLKAADAVIFVRGDSDFECYLAEKLARAGKYLIYVLDDDLLNVPDYLVSFSHYASDSVRKNIKTLMQRCNCLMTPSEKLARKYGELFEQTVFIEEPALCCKKRQPSGKTVKIGFAGSVDRTQDFEHILAQPLRNIQKKYGDGVSIEFFGIEPPVAQELECKCYPYAADYPSYQKTMEKLEWDIGLAPMPDTEFHSCKHYNKFIEYGSFGIISLCSALPPYNRIIRNWENGALCPNEAAAWEAALCRLIEDAQLRFAMQENLYRQISGSFRVPQVAQQLWQQLDALIPHLKKHRIGWMLPNKIHWRAKWMLSKIHRYGWGLPIAALRKIPDYFSSKARKES